MIIKIKNLKLKALIGVYESERVDKQDIIINVMMEFYADKAIQYDDINETIDYDYITKRIIKEVEDSQYFLLEKLADNILNIITEDVKIIKASVEIDKLCAITLADSVSIISNFSRHGKNE